jgi:hypothetical protein
MANITVKKKVGENLIITVEDEIVVPPIPPTSAFKDHFIPGRIQFEDFDLGGEGKGYHDTDAVNQGGQYRQEGVDVEGTTQRNVGYTAKGEWLQYTLKQVIPGKYKLNANVASITTIGKFTVSIDGKILATISVPNTGAWSTYKVVSADVDVPDGKIVRIDVLEGSFNGDYIEFVNFSAPPVPPTTGGISSGFKEAIQTAGQGKTVLFAKGTYPIDQINVPIGVSVDLGDSTLIGTAPGGFNQDKPMFRLNGNQKFGNGSINGKNIISSMVTASGDNIQIDGINGQDCNWLGIWLNGARNSKVSNFKLRNTSGATTSWAAGELCFSNLNNVEITGGDLSSDSKTRGYGMKAMYQDSTLKDVQISNVKIDMNADSVWNNGMSKNIGLELHQTRITNVEIFNCEFYNQMSLSYQYQGGKTVVRNNMFDMAKSTYIIEYILDGLEFYGNTCKNWQMITANFRGQYINNDPARPIKWANAIIRDNNFLSPAGIPTWGGAFYQGETGVVNFSAKNNTIEIKRGQKPLLLKFRGTTGGVNNIEADNVIREV